MILHELSILFNKLVQSRVISNAQNDALLQYRNTITHSNTSWRLVQALMMERWANGFNKHGIYE